VYSISSQEKRPRITTSVLSNRSHLSGRKETNVGLSKYMNSSLSARKPESVRSSHVFNRKVSFAAVKAAQNESDKKPARKMPSVKTQVYKDNTVDVQFDQLDSENSIIFEANVEEEQARPEKDK
jgi:hypothetical protein